MSSRAVSSARSAQSGNDVCGTAQVLPALDPAANAADLREPKRTTAMPVEGVPGRRNPPVSRRSAIRRTPPRQGQCVVYSGPECHPAVTLSTRFALSLSQSALTGRRFHLPVPGAVLDESNPQPPCRASPEAGPGLPWRSPRPAKPTRRATSAESVGSRLRPASVRRHSGFRKRSHLPPRRKQVAPGAYAYGSRDLCTANLPLRSDAVAAFAAHKDALSRMFPFSWPSPP